MSSFGTPTRTVVTTTYDHVPWAPRPSKRYLQRAPSRSPSRPSRFSQISKRLDFSSGEEEDDDEVVPATPETPKTPKTPPKTVSSPIYISETEAMSEEDQVQSPPKLGFKPPPFITAPVPATPAPVVLPVVPSSPCFTPASWKPTKGVWRSLEDALTSELERKRQAMELDLATEMHHLLSTREGAYKEWLEKLQHCRGDLTMLEAFHNKFGASGVFSGSLSLFAFPETGVAALLQMLYAGVTDAKSTRPLFDLVMGYVNWGYVLEEVNRCSNCARLYNKQRRYDTIEEFLFGKQKKKKQTRLSSSSSSAFSKPHNQRHRQRRGPDYSRPPTPSDEEEE
jgi:hypothetical protein